MTRLEELRLQGSLLLGGATIPPMRGDHMANRMATFAAQDEELGSELRTASQQLAANIDTLTGCTVDQRLELRALAMFLAEAADRLAPVAAVYDPEPGNVVHLRPLGRFAESAVS